MNQREISCKIQLFNNVPLEMISGGNIYNQNLIKELQNRNININYNQGNFDYNCNVSIIDSLAMHKVDFSNVKKHKNNFIIALIHEIPKIDNKGLMFYKMYSSFVVTGQPIKKHLIDEWGIDEKKIRIIRPGIEANWTPKTRTSKNKRNSILLVGNFIRSKGYDLFIEILELLKGEPFTYHLVGNNAIDKNYANEVIKKLKYLNYDVQFHFNVSREEMYQCYLHSDLYLSVSKSETFGMAIFESLSLGLDCIAYYTGDVDYFQEYESYKGIEKYQADIFAEGIKESMNTTIKKNMNYKFQKRRTWGNTGSEFFEYIKEIIEC